MSPLGHCVPGKADDAAGLDNKITSAQISIQCTKYIGNSVQWSPTVSLRLVNMQCVMSLLRGSQCCWTVFTYTMANELGLFPPKSGLFASDTIWEGKSTKCSRHSQDLVSDRGSPSFTWHRGLCPCRNPPAAEASHPT